MLVCASCGHENSEDAKFCEECGFSFGAVRAKAHEQRKTVTVLFCDITGSTSLGETLDPERLRALLAHYFERMKTIVERHGGTVEKFIGDAVMAVFGYRLCTRTTRCALCARRSRCAPHCRSWAWRVGSGS